MHDPSYLADVQTFAGAGWAVFPVRNKKPLVEWTKDATTDPGVIGAWWRQFNHPDFAWRIPPDVLVVDVDDPVAFAGTELPLPETAHQPTAVEGHSHHVYTTTGVELRQRARVVPGADYRVGGRGYIVLYKPRDLLAEWMPAPEWPAEIEGQQAGSVIQFPERRIANELGTRDEILLALGSIAALGKGFDIRYYVGMLAGWRAQGVLIDLDAGRPWTDDDLVQLAKEAEEWDQKAKDEKKWSEGQLQRLEHQIAKGKESKTGMTRLADVVRIDPPPLLLGRWAPDGASILYGTGGVGKGRLAAQEIAALTKLERIVLIADYEDHLQEWLTRIEDCGGDLGCVYHIAPFSMNWKAGGKNILDHAEAIAEAGVECNADYLVIDSAMMTVPGLDVGDPSAPQKWAAALQRIGLPSLTLAHVTKADANPRYPFGSIYWHNLARITWSLADVDGRFVLQSRKHNSYPELARVKFLLETQEDEPEDGKVRVRNPAWKIVLTTRPIAEQIGELLTERGAMSIREIRQALAEDGSEVKDDSVLKALKRSGLVETGDGRWAIKGQPQPKVTTTGQRAMTQAEREAALDEIERGARGDSNATGED